MTCKVAIDLINQSTSIFGLTKDQGLKLQKKFTENKNKSSSSLHILLLMRNISMARFSSR